MICGFHVMYIVFTLWIRERRRKVTKVLTKHFSRGQPVAYMALYI